MFSDPIKNLKAFGIREDDVIADLGAGTGFYSLAAGEMAQRGKVYAVEIAEDFLEIIKNKIKDAHLDNVEIIWGNIEKRDGTQLADGILDKVIASNVLSQVEDKESFIFEIKRILKPKGRVLLIDWVLDSPVVVKLKKAFPKEKVFKMFEEKGFVLERDINVGAHHYGMILIKN